MEAAHRRLKEEIGMEVEIKKLFDFQYLAHLDNDLIEHELDHVFIGYSDDIPQLNQEEVCSYRYISSENLASEIEQYPERFTEWFKLLFPRILNEIGS